MMMPCNVPPFLKGGFVTWLASNPKNVLLKFDVARLRPKSRTQAASTRQRTVHLEPDVIILEV